MLGLPKAIIITFSLTIILLNNGCGKKSSETTTPSGNTGGGGGGTSDTSKPSVPTNLTATAASENSINLSWTASSDNVAVTGYTVYRGGAQTATTTTTSYTDTGLSASTLYTYTVSAYDAAGNASATSTPASTTTKASGGGEAPDYIVINNADIYTDKINITLGKPGKTGTLAIFLVTHDKKKIVLPRYDKASVNAGTDNYTFDLYNVWKNKTATVYTGIYATWTTNVGIYTSEINDQFISKNSKLFSQIELLDLYQVTQYNTPYSNSDSCGTGTPATAHVYTDRNTCGSSTSYNVTRTFIDQVNTEGYGNIPASGFIESNRIAPKIDSACFVNWTSDSSFKTATGPGASCRPYTLADGDVAVGQDKFNKKNTFL